MRPVSGNGRRSFFLQKHFYNQTYTTQTNFQICTLLSYLSLLSCLSAAPQGRKSKGAVCAALVCGGSRERSCCLSAVFRTAATFCLLAFACPLRYLILSCLARYLPCASCPVSAPACFLVFELPGRFLIFLTAGIVCICRLLLFLV